MKAMVMKKARTTQSHLSHLAVARPNFKLGPSMWNSWHKMAKFIVTTSRKSSWNDSSVGNNLRKQNKDV